MEAPEIFHDAPHGVLPSFAPHPAKVNTGVGRKIIARKLISMPAWTFICGFVGFHEKKKEKHPSADPTVAFDLKTKTRSSSEADKIHVVTRFPDQRGWRGWLCIPLGRHRGGGLK
ncbi:transposase [Anopheles sinensis]|uniref:Transposase n=1 Tax=Anopheles sinensis TaxID=74873 RepID=A0A084W1V0_ANOSI|nr:transposase [Anopheles sinensis]